MSDVRLGAALFNGDHARLGEELVRLETAGLDFIHLDVFDGRFVSDLGFSPRTIADLRPLTKMPFEVHLGVVDPLRMLPALVEAGADLVLVHVESLPLPYEGLRLARSNGIRLGLAATLGTPVGQLEPLLSLVDAVLLLSRVTGEGVSGTSFDPLVLPRLRALVKLIDKAHLEVDVQVAGGVRVEHVGDLLAAGATTLAVGGGIYRVPDMAAAITEMREIARQKE